MSDDLPDLPLFAGLDQSPIQPRNQPGTVSRRRSTKISSGHVEAPSIPIREREMRPQSFSCAKVIAFPPHRDIRIVNTLLDRWIGLNKRFEINGAYRVFKAKYESPIIQRLFKLGLNPQEIDAEILRIEYAIEALSNRRRAEQVPTGSAAR